MHCLSLFLFCPQKRVFLTTRLLGGQLADCEEKTDEWDHLCFGRESPIQPLMYALIVLALKNSTWHCVASHPAVFVEYWNGFNSINQSYLTYLSQSIRVNLLPRLLALGTWFYKHPYCTDSDILLFLFLLTNVLTISNRLTISKSLWIKLLLNALNENLHLLSIYF